MPTEEAKVSIEDIGLLRGYGIYAGITTANSKPFRLDDHFDQFEKSAKTLNLKIPYSRKKIAEVLEELIKKHNFKRTNFRLILTGGKTEKGVCYHKEKPTFYILAEEWKSLPKKIYTEGASLVTFEHQRLLPEIKTINYIRAISLQDYREKHNAIEVLFTSKDKVLEASMSNFFMFKSDKLITSKESIFQGITRKVILELAQKHFKIEERLVSVKEVTNADEIFITGSFKDIVPIISIDNKKIGSSSVGVGTKKMMKLFNDYTKSF
ncbi:MAG: aminotransferase class IV [Patescibacteria group bacterium]|nr:aminotransferase class IV [Patescibacteria group bacterium]